MLILNSCVALIYRIKLLLLGRLATFKLIESSPILSLGYGYGAVSASEK